MKISSDLSEFDLNLPADEPIEFVEILSEQDVQLLFLSANDAAEQWAEIQLSDGRTLEVCLQTKGGPRLHVVYNDPVVEEISSDGCRNRRLSVLTPHCRAQSSRKRWLDV